MSIKVAHLGDVHLGYSAHRRTDLRGINWREIDVVVAFRQAVEQIIEYEPRLVAIAGDFFDVSRPSNSIVVEAFRQISHLSSSLPDADVVIVGGNHDAPRTAGAGNILRLFEAIPRVHVVVDEPKLISLSDLAVVGMPHGAGHSSRRMLESAEVTSALSGKPSVLVVHAAIRARDGRIRYAENSKGGIPIDLLKPGKFTYIAAGDFHEAAEIQEGAWYSGSLEYVSSGYWTEPKEKGWLAVELVKAGRSYATADVELRTVETREMFDLPEVDATGMSAEAVMERVAANLAAIGGATDRLVRQVVRNIPSALTYVLDWPRIRRWRADAIHFHLDLRKPERPNSTQSALSRKERKKNLVDTVKEYVRDHFTPAEGVEKDDVVRMIEEALREEE